MLTVDEAGWVIEAKRYSSPNYNQRPHEIPIDLLVIHSISLPPGQFGGEDITRLFLNQLDCHSHPYYHSLIGLEVSSHFLIRRNGELIQYVSCNDRAWHAGVSHWRGRDNCNDFSIGIELEGDVESPFTEEQYTTLHPLILTLKARYPIQEVVGHEHIAPGRKEDPGPYFDWSRLPPEVSGMPKK